MAVLDKTKNDKCWSRCGEKGTLYTVHGDENATATMGLPQNLNIELPCDPAFSLLDIYPK